MRPEQYSILYLALTSRCNLACSYCPVPKADVSMSRLTAERGSDLLLHDSVRELRFFGGEPLLEFELVRQLVERLLSSGKAPHNMIFRLTSNGTLLDEEKLDFIESNTRIQLVLSIDGAAESHLGQRTAKKGSPCDAWDWLERYAGRIASLERPAIANMVVCPQNVSKMAENFAFVIRKGFRRINILPAFYVEWNEDQISELRGGLAKLAAMTDKLWRDGFKLEIENLHVNVEKPLLSGGLLLDCDGELYSGDIAMLFEPGEPRRRFSLGNIAHIGTLDELCFCPDLLDDRVLAERFSSAALESTRCVDAELSDFVALLNSARMN